MKENFPPLKRGGPIEAESLVQLLDLGTLFPPLKRGGPIEAVRRVVDQVADLDPFRR